MFKNNLNYFCYKKTKCNNFYINYINSLYFPFYHQNTLIKTLKKYNYDNLLPKNKKKINLTNILSKINNIKMLE